jgi:hypothetical protein
MHVRMILLVFGAAKSTPHTCVRHSCLFPSVSEFVVNELEAITLNQIA